MARFIPKQFAENSTTSVVFGSFQEQGGNPGDGTISSDPATLQGGAAWPLGWSAATDNFFQIPRGEEMEGLERVLSAAIIQQFKDGLTFWQPEMPVTQYQTIVQYQTGSDLPKLYINITGTSTSTPPDSDTTNWFMFCDTAQVLANVSLTNSPYTTNRILEIPQDIKLELSNGTLTVKAGSKVRVPNGVDVFDEITTTQDGVVSFPGQTPDCLIFRHPNGVFTVVGKSQCFSGGSAPSGQTYMMWFDTTNGLMKFTSNSGSTWTSGYSLPLGICHAGTSNFTSIDQIFNGFGYIGSTVFALPGVKGAIPNGRNENGTCKATLTTLMSVKTDTFTGAAQRGWYLQTNGASSGNSPVYSDTQPSQNYIRWFSQKDNQWYDTHSSPELNSETYVLPLASFNTDSTGKITSFKLCTVDSVANSNASNFSQAGRSYLSGLGMPSSRYIDLTLGASGSTYTAPANGYFNLAKVSGGIEFINGINHNTLYYEQRTSAGVDMTETVVIPAQKGDTVEFLYNMTRSTSSFRFIYAEGEN